MKTSRGILGSPLLATALTLVWALGLSGCGQKGPLMLAPATSAQVPSDQGSQSQDAPSKK